MDAAIYRRRHEKSAAALVAVARVLARRRPLGGAEDEFLRLHDRVAAADPRVFGRVWTDPVAYWWSRLAYELVGATVTGEDPSRQTADYRTALGAADFAAALTAHLEDFKRFALAVEIVRGGGIELESPWVVRPPLAIPGTRLALEGGGAVAIAGAEAGGLRLRDGRVLVLADRAVDGEPVLRACPVLAAGDREILLQPSLLNLRGLALAAGVVGLDVDYQERHVGLLRQAVLRIARHQPESHELFVSVMKAVVVKPMSLGGFTNVSHSDLPGVSLCGVVSDPDLMADTLIHELHHNRLFALEEDGPFFADDAMTADESYYSPWREDLRPLHGILHGLYVYPRLFHFWRSVARAGEATPGVLAFAADQLARIPLQLEIARAQLRRHGRFTELGARVLDEIAGEVDRVAAIAADPEAARAMVCALDGTIRPETAAGSEECSVRRSVAAHVERFDLHRQCSGLVG